LLDGGSGANLRETFADAGGKPSRGAAIRQKVSVEAHPMANWGAASLFPAFFFLYQQMIGAACAVRTANCPDIDDRMSSRSVKTDSGHLIHGSLEECGRNVFGVLRRGQRGVLSRARKFVTKLKIDSLCQVPGLFIFVAKIGGRTGELSWNSATRLKRVGVHTRYG